MFYKKEGGGQKGEGRRVSFEREKKKGREGETYSLSRGEKGVRRIKKRKKKKRKNRKKNIHPVGEKKREKERKIKRE